MSAFDSKNRTYRHRNEIAVSIRLAGEATPVDGTIFASLGERASDLLNDDRAFIPVRIGNSETMIVAKTQIASLMERKTNPQEKDDGFTEGLKGADKAAKSFDPYAMLRVAPDAKIEDVRAAYKARIKAVHPDTLASLGLDEDLAKAALLATQKVNYAYQKIMRDRGAKAERMV